MSLVAYRLGQLGQVQHIMEKNNWEGGGNWCVGYWGGGRRENVRGLWTNTYTNIGHTIHRVNNDVIPPYPLT